MNSNTTKSIVYMSENRTIYVGKLQRSLSQSKAPSMLMVSIDGDLQLIDQKNKHSYHSKSLLIPAGMQTTINTNNSIILFCFLGVLGTDLATLKQHMRKTISLDGKTSFYSGLRHEDRIIDSALTFLNTQPSAESAFKQLEEWAGCSDSAVQVASDDRVVEIIELIKANPVENIPINEITKRLNLSAPRLHQLFKDITGIPIRRYRIWMRIYMAVAKIAEGLSITEAALASGFSDSAHFSRIFKEISGAKPRDVLSMNHNMNIRVLPPEDIISFSDTLENGARFIS